MQFSYYTELCYKLIVFLTMRGVYISLGSFEKKSQREPGRFLWDTVQKMFVFFVCLFIFLLQDFAIHQQRRDQLLFEFFIHYCWYTVGKIYKGKHSTYNLTWMLSKWTFYILVADKFGDHSVFMKFLFYSMFSSYFQFFFNSFIIVNWLLPTRPKLLAKYDGNPEFMTLTRSHYH